MAHSISEYRKLVEAFYAFLRNNPQRKKTNHDWELAAKHVWREKAISDYPEFSVFFEAIGRQPSGSSKKPVAPKKKGVVIEKIIPEVVQVSLFVEPVPSWSQRMRAI